LRRDDDGLLKAQAYPLRRLGATLTRKSSMSDHSPPPSHEKHVNDAKIWGITIIASAGLLVLSGFFVKSVKEETLPELKASSSGQLGQTSSWQAFAARAAESAPCRLGCVR
jgi:hypothetical protein